LNLPIVSLRHLPGTSSATSSKSSEDAEHRAAEQHVVELGDDVVRWFCCVSLGDAEVRDTRRSTDRELDDQADGESIAVVKCSARPIVSVRLTISSRQRGDGDQHCADREHTATLTRPDRWRTCGVPKRPIPRNRNAPGEHRRTCTEQWLSTEHQQHLADDAEGWVG